MKKHKKTPHCDNDHWCCQQSLINVSLSKTIDIQRDQIKKIQEEKLFLQQLNKTLMKDFEKKLKIALKQQEQQNINTLTELQTNYEKQIAELRDEMTKKQLEILRRFKQETQQLQKNYDNIKLKCQKLEVEHEEAKSNIEMLTQERNQLQKDLENKILEQADDKDKIVRLNQQIESLERNILTANMKIQGQNLALKSFEQRQSQLSQRILQEERQKKQAMVTVLSKQTMLRSLENEIANQGSVRDRLLHENKALQQIVNSLDSHVFDLRKHEYSMMKQLQDVHQLAACKQQALENLKSDVHKLKYTI